MKKIFSTIMTLALAAFVFTSCEDVPMPYGVPEQGGSEEGGSTEVLPAGTGTEADPFNVAAIVSYVNTLDANVVSEQAYYVKGKISKITTKETDFPTYHNHSFEMVDEGNNTVKFTAFQVNAPGNKPFTSMEDVKVGDEVVVYGKVTNYMGNTPETVGKGAAYVVSINGNGGSGGDDPTPDPTPGEFMTVAQAINAQGTNGSTVKGYIVAALKYGVSSSNGDVADLEFAAPFTGYNAIFIADSPTEKDPSKMLCAKLNDTESPADLKSKVNLKDNPSNLGKELTLTGNLKACYTGLKGIRGITSYVLEGSSSGGDNNPGEAYSYDFKANNQGDWTIVDKKLPAGATYIWSYDSKYGMKASAFVNKANNDGESWLVSPAITLAGNAKTLTIHQASNFIKNDINQENKVCISTDGGNTWTQLSVTNAPVGNSWTFVDSTVDISAYAGKSVKISFQYVSTTASTSTWEIEKIAIK